MQNLLAILRILAPVAVAWLTRPRPAKPARAETPTAPPTPTP